MRLPISLPSPPALIENSYSSAMDRAQWLKNLRGYVVRKAANKGKEPQVLQDRSEEHRVAAWAVGNRHSASKGGRKCNTRILYWYAALIHTSILSLIPFHTYTLNVIVDDGHLKQLEAAGLPFENQKRGWKA